MSADRDLAWQAYLQHLARNHRSKGTVDQYTYTILPLWRWLDARTPPVPWDEVTPELLDQWLKRIPKGNARRRRLSDRAKSHYSILVGTFYTWAHADGHLERNPLARAVPHPAPTPRARALTRDQVRRLLDHVAGDQRLELLVWLAYGCGLRCREIGTLEVGDVDLDRGELTVHGKGGKDRTVPIAAPVQDVLERYLATLPADARTDRLVRHAYTAGGRPVGETYVSKLLSGAMRAAGLEDTGHSLRHTFATTLLEASDGRDLRPVSRMLGHSSTLVTERVYVNSSDAGCRRTVDLLPDPKPSQNLTNLQPVARAVGGAIAPHLHLQEWRARLEAADPGLLTEIDSALSALQRLAPGVVLLLDRIWGLSSRFNRAFYESASRTDPAVDPVRDQVEDHVGVGGLWALADALRDAHPDEHVLSVAERLVFEAECAQALGE
jgi:site-specific recombinase XerD